MITYNGGFHSKLTVEFRDKKSTYRIRDIWRGSRKRNLAKQGTYPLRLYTIGEF